LENFHGTIQSLNGREVPLRITLQYDGERVRMWSDRNRIGSWSLDQVKVKRDTIFRFRLEVDDESYLFCPDDPSGFARSVEVEIDLTTPRKARFGLAERIRQVEGN
jgi:hypothetical protein